MRTLTMTIRGMEDEIPILGSVKTVSVDGGLPQQWFITEVRAKPIQTRYACELTLERVEEDDKN